MSGRGRNSSNINIDNKVVKGDPVRYDKFVMAQMNKKEVINLIRRNSPINKAEIAKLAGLSIPTVMKITDEFEQKGLIRSIGKGKSCGGKRPQLLEMVDTAYYIVGVGIGRNTTRVIVMDMAGRPVSGGTIKTGETLPAEVFIQRVIQLIDQVILESGVGKEKILGMGIGMPGLLDNEKNIVLFSPDFLWENVDIVTPIAAHFQFDIFFENSNRALAMGERWFGSGVNSDYFICVSLGHGIGSAIVENGEFYRGSCGSSGEIGHITLEKDGLLCSCGNRGCLEALASGNAIARKGQEAVRCGRKTKILEIAGNDIDAIDAKVVFEAAKVRDKVAKEIVDSAIEYIGIGLASYINLLDPDKIILAGGILNAGDYFWTHLINVIKERQMSFAGRKVKIQKAKLGEDAAAIGAATLVLKAFIDNGCTKKDTRSQIVKEGTL